MKELTFKEVVENIKVGEVWECTRKDARIKSIRLDRDIDNRILIFDCRGTALVEEEIGVRNTDRFKLQRKEYTFEEAFRAYEEGKEIESVLSTDRFKKSKIEDKKFDCFWDEGVKNWFKFRTFELEEIRDKWYIND